nr:hypothetical protein [Tanacetum cinerariifolium]
MSRDVITVGLIMRLPLLYRGEHSQWRERFMNYLEEKMDGEAMINSIQNGDHPLPVVAQVSLAGTTQNAPPTLKDPKFLTVEEKKTQKIDRDVNDALGYKKKVVVVTSDPLALVAEKTKITALLAKDFNRKKYYDKPTNNNLRTFLASSSANKKPEYVKSVEKKEDKKADEKKRDMSKVHFAKDCKKEKDQAWMESSSDSDQEINKNMVFMAKMENVLSDSDESSSSAEETIAEKKTKILELEGSVSNNDVEIEKCLERLNECENKLHKIGQTNQTIHMIMPSKDTLYNGRKGIGFENPTYFEKLKDLRPSLYDEKDIGLGYTLMFLTHSGVALEMKKFKRAIENKIEFAYDYRNLNASYVNEKINFSNDYFQKIINPDFEKIDSPFMQTNSLKPYVSTVILEKIIIDLEDEVVSLLEKEKANLETIESLKSKCFESSEKAISESKNQSENDFQVVEKGCDQVGNSKVIALGMFKLNVSQSVSAISV